MIPASDLRTLLERIDTVPSAADRDRLIQDLVPSARGRRTLSFLNQHGVNLAAADREVWAALMGSDVLLRDGVGVEFALKALGRPPGVNCNGTDAIQDILRASRGRNAAVFGTQEPWLSSAVDAIRALGVNVVASGSGFGKEADYLDATRRHRPEIVLLGMGMPRQELLSTVLRRELDHPCLIVNGGAILDFLGGRFPRAPGVVQRLRLEWLFRLAQEPRRLFGRYVSGGWSFARLILAMRRVRSDG